MLHSSTKLVALKSSLGFWNVTEYLSTGIVLIGVLGEYVAEFTEFANTRTLTRPLGKLSTLVLILGLSGELLGLVRSSQLSGQLIASLEEEASQSTKDAESAKTLAKGFEASIATANARAKSAEARVAAATARAAEAMRVAESERLERAKIEQRLADRVFSDEQKSKLVWALSHLPRTTVLIASIVGNNEAERYARQIIPAFGPEGAGWNVRVALSRISLTNAGPGITIGWGKNLKPTAMALKRAFASVGISAEMLQMTGGDSDEITIFVSSKE